jgi:hypothetical protein
MTPILTTGYSESPEKIADRMKRLNELHEQRMAEKEAAKTITMQMDVEHVEG